MFACRRYGRPRRCIFYIFAFVISQLVFILILFRNGSYDDLPACGLHRNNDTGKNYLDWSEFISHPRKGLRDYYQYNLHLSDTLGVIRKLPSTRHCSCDSRPRNLPPPSSCNVSVVISFHNEARSMLLRTIVSLLSRTPKEYLHELIIVDDGSEDVTLLDDLRRWMDVFLGTRDRLGLIFLVNQERMGLIWSRNRGALLASGHHVLFLDSHCEVNEGWLEPLLERLVQDPNLAVSPILDPIDPKTLSYRRGNEMLKGGFDWSLHFHWLRRRLANQELPEMPYKSPAFAGGVLMMSRDWFLKLGGFNAYLKIWGGESIELAIKLWLCGGQIEIVPCSRIGHIFRRRHAFDFPPHLDDHQLSSAQETYLQMHFDELAATGTLRNEDRCLHATHKDSDLILVSCHLSDITQWRMLRSSGQLSTQRELCLGVAVGRRIVLAPCGRNGTARMAQQWLRRGTHLLHAETHLCLDNPLKDRLELSACRSQAVSQSFQFALEMESRT